MRNRFVSICTFLIVLFTSVLAGTVAPAIGQVIAVAPFQGNHSETWEEFPNFLDGGFHLLADPTIILNGEGFISNPQVTVYQPILADANLGGSGFAQTADGVKGVQFGSLDPTTTITFVHPFTQFGAYWGAETFGVSSTIEVNFYDTSDALFAVEQFDYNHEAGGDGGLDWHGWQSTTPFAKLSFTGDLVAIDSLQAVPEPANMTAFIAAGVVLVSVFLRRRRHK